MKLMGHWRPFLLSLLPAASLKAPMTMRSLYTPTAHLEQLPFENEFGVFLAYINASEITRGSCR